jgi:hypothetical protein
VGIATRPYRPLSNTRLFADFHTGERVDDVRSTFNFTAYVAQLAKYPYLLYSWNIPDPTPEDRLLPFENFVKDYHLQNEAFDIYSSASGVPNILGELTVYMFKLIDGPLVESSSGSSVVPANNNGEIHVKTAERLGDDVLLSSTVMGIQRDGESASLVIKMPQGNKHIQVSKLLVMIPPLLDTTESATVLEDVLY